MNDRWNAADVKWSNENIERELKKIEKEAQHLADQALREQLILLAVVIVALLACLFYLGAVAAMVVETIMLCALLRYMWQAQKKAQAPIYQMCDPYLQFAYIRAYAGKSMLKTKVMQRRQLLSMAQCMVLAGEPQAAMSIQSMITEPQKLKVSERCIYYNTLLLSYGLCGWGEKRSALLAEIKRIKGESGKMAALRFDIILKLEEVKRHQDIGDIEYVEAYFKQVPPVYRFQEVGMHYGLGMMYMKDGDVGNAREHVEFVLEKGNKLYYKNKMEEYLRTGMEDEPPMSDPQSKEIKEHQPAQQLEICETEMQGGSEDEI